MNRALRVFAAVAILAGCEQRPVDVAPESVGTRWIAVGTEERPAWYGVVAGLARDDVYIVGDGELLHFDGDGVTPIPVDGGAEVRDAAVYPTGGLLVATRESILRFDGSRFVHLVDFPGEYIVRVSVGEDGSVSAVAWGLLIRFDGTAWYADNVDSQPRVYSSWGSSATDVYAGTSGGLYHFDGAGWTPVAGMSDYYPYLWGTGPGDVFAISGSTVWHFDGAAWRGTTVSSRYLHRPWGAGAGDVYVPGTGGFIHHFNGVEWDTIDTGTAADIVAVWASGADDVYAVGAGARVMRSDGSRWWSVLGGAPSAAYSAAGTPNGGAIIVSAEYPDATALFRFDGSAFAEELVLRSEYAIRGVWASPTGIAYAVGTGGTVYRHDGVAWKREITPTLENLNAVSGADDATCAVGNLGTVLLRKNGKWIPISEFPLTNYTDVWLQSANQVFAVSRHVIHHLRNGVWNEVILDGRWEVHLWGGGPDDVVAVSEGGGAFHFDGRSWTRQPVPIDSQWWGIAGGGESDVYALGSDDLMHYDGTIWSLWGRRMPGPYITRGWVDGSGTLFGLDESWPYIYRLEVTR